MTNPDPAHFFWQLAGPLLTKEDITKGTIMGFPCLRVHGQFFATSHHQSGDLIVKLPATRVQELIGAGTGRAFAPAGKVFREWVAIAERGSDLWQQLLAEAEAFGREKHP